MNNNRLKEYEIQCLLQTCATYRMQTILSILSNDKYSNQEKVQQALLIVKEYWKESIAITEELQKLDISEIYTLLYSDQSLLQ